jgi:hypothetical protein
MWLQFVFILLFAQSLFSLRLNFAGSPATRRLSLAPLQNAEESAQAAPVHIMENPKKDSTMEYLFEFYRPPSNETVIASLGGSKDNLEKFFNLKFGIPHNISDLSFKEVFHDNENRNFADLSKLRLNKCCRL